MSALALRISCGRLPASSRATISRWAAALALARDAGRKPPGVERGQQLARLDTVAFLHEQRRDALAVVKGQLHLADVHVAVQHQVIGGLRLSTMMPIPETGHDHGHQ